MDGAHDEDKGERNKGRLWLAPENKERAEGMAHVATPPIPACARLVRIGALDGNPRLTPRPPSPTLFASSRMAASQRNGDSSTRASKSGTLPSLDNLTEGDLSALVDSLVKSKELRREVWAEEMARMSTVPEEREAGKAGGQDGSSGDHVTPISGLRSLLVASVAPKPSPPPSQQAGESSGSSTPSRPTPGSRTPMEEVSVQMVYQAVFCFWLFSFDVEIASELNVKFGIIPILADVARNAVKEKVVRVIVATLKNLAEKAPQENISAMLGCKCLPLMESLAGRKWSDEEIPQDIDVIKELLSDKLKVMSNYDQFVSELASGRLTWDNPAHSLDEFWKENTTKLLDASANEDHARQSGLTMLINLLTSGDSDSTTLAIACNDIAKIITFSPETGKKQVEKEGGKARIMELMTHKDGEVKFYALNTVSRLVSASWRG